MTGPAAGLRCLEILASSTAAMLSGVRADLLAVAADPEIEPGRAALMRDLDTAIHALHAITAPTPPAGRS